MKRLYAIGLLMIFLLVGAGYSSHMLSSETRVNISGVFSDWTDGRNWTAPNATEIFNFTVVNDAESNDSVVSVNITMESAFTLNASTIGSSSNFACTNATPLLINCTNTSTGGLGSGDTMYVWFNVTSGSVGSEMPNEWIINTSDNATQMNGTVLYSWIDGKVTEAAEPDALESYINTQPLLNWTNHSGCDNVSGILNYTIYHSADSSSVNFTVNGSTLPSNRYYQTSGLSVNHVHYFKVQTNDNAGNAVNSSVKSTTIDITEPSVYLNTVNYENFTDTYYPRLYFNVTDNFDDNMSCEVFVDGNPNGTAYILNNTPGLSIQVNSSLLGEGHSWHVNCTDDTGNTGKSTPPRTLNVVGADVVVESVYFNTTADTNPIASSDMKVFAVVKNVGNRNISENVTVAFYLDGTDIEKNVTISNETLTAGQNKTVNVTYTTNFQNTFNHTLKAEATANSATELNATNNIAYNYSLYVGYNVTITEITPDTVDNTSVNISVTFSVKHPDGSAAASISWSNVSIASSTYSNDRINTSAFSSPSSGIYTFNVTSSVNYNGDTNPGLHTISVSATRNESGKLFTGSDTDAYNQTVPMPDHSGTDCDGAISNSHAEDVVITIKNSGITTLYNITATPELYLSGTKKTYISPTSCWSIPNSLAAGATHACTFTITPTTDGDYEIRLTVTGNDSAGRTYSRAFGVIDFFTVSTQTQQTPDPGTTGTDTPSPGTDYPNCAVNDDCFGDEYCNSHLVCVELDCADDEKILDHACVKKESAAAKTTDYSLAITGGPAELEIEHGDSRNTTFKLKNNGEKTLIELKFELKLKDASVNISEWYAVLSNYSATLKKGIVESVKVEINTADFSIGTYEIIALAKSDKAGANMTFTLKVTPDDNEKTLINETMANLDSDYTEIYNQLQVLLHENINNTNLTNLNNTVAKVAEYLNTAKLAIESGDYLAAYQNQMSADSLMVEIRSKLDGDDLVKGEKKSHLLRNSLIVIVLVVFGVFGFQHYREMQESGGYHPDKGFRIKKKNAFRENILSEVSALKGSIRGKKGKSSPPLKLSLNYASYSSSKKQDNILKRIIEKFSAKKQNPNQKTLYDIGNVYNKKVKKKKVFCY